MESTDQDYINQSNSDQPDDIDSEENSQTIDVNWEKLTIDELKAWYLRQSDYTRKTQELSKLKKENSLSEEDKQAIDFIKSNWFLTKEDLENFQTRQSQDNNLKDILMSNPDLQPFESAIKELWSTTWLAYEDIIQKYGFKSREKLNKARSQVDIKWMPWKKEKSISEMSFEEYEKYKQKMWWTNRWTFS